MVLVEQHKPQARILVANSPSEQAQEAASILQNYIEKISNARIEIGSESEDVSGNIILVGHSQRVKDLSVTVPSGFTFQLNEEGFVIKTVENSLILAGNEDGEYRGTIYAVYAFLEKLGCRWFFPGEFGEVVPEIDTISIKYVYDYYKFEDLGDSSFDKYRVDERFVNKINLGYIMNL